MTDDTAINLTKHLMLVAEVRVWIYNGMFWPGEPLPPITDLVADRGWSRQACALALQSLAAEGLLARRPGSGYYVAPPQPA